MAELEKENRALREVIAELKEKIASLERSIKLSSETSSKPLSSDGLKKKKKEKRTESLRIKGQRKTGGQKGHEGKTLEQVENPDKIHIHHSTLGFGEYGFLQKLLR